MNFVKIFVFFIGTLSSQNPYFHANQYLQPKGRNRGLTITAQAQIGDLGSSSWIHQQSSQLEKQLDKQQHLFDSQQNNFMEEMGRVLGFSDGLQNIIKQQQFGQQHYYPQQPYNHQQINSQQPITQQPIMPQQPYFTKPPITHLPYVPQPQQPDIPHKPYTQAPYNSLPQQPYNPQQTQKRPRSNGDLFPESNSQPDLPEFITTTTTTAATKQRQYCHASLSGFTILHRTNKIKK